MSLNEDLTTKEGQSIFLSKLNNILEGKVRFSQVSKFNDRFEGQWSGKIDSIGPEEFKKIINEAKKSGQKMKFYYYGSTRDRPDLEALVPCDCMTPRNQSGIYDDNNKEEFKLDYLKDIQIQIDEITQTLGVFCLSRSYDSQLMWSHYADKERGICIEYDALNPFFLGKAETVIYSNKRYSLGPINDNWEKYSHFDKVEELKAWIRSGLCYKNDCWIYEQECRVIENIEAKDFVDGCIDISMPENAITGIYYGCELNEEIENRLQYSITQIFKEKVKRYKMIQMKDTFGYEAIEYKGG